jgi:hypothetical protein
MGPHAIAVLPIEVIVTLGIHDKRNLIEAPLTALRKIRSVHGRNIALKTPNQIRAPLSVDLGPLGVSRFSPWLMKGDIAPLFVTLGFIGNIHIVHGIRKTVMRILHFNCVVVFFGSIEGLRS